MPTAAAPPAAEDDGEDRPPMPGDEDAPPAMEEPVSSQSDVPMGFWSDLVGAVRQELKTPIAGFFAATPNAPVTGILRGDRVVLQCTNSFTAQMIDKPEIREIVGRKASALLGKQTAIIVEDKSAKPEQSAAMNRLMDFGRAHSDIVKIKET